MPSRRSVLAAAVAMVGAGCSNRGETDVDPSNHVPDDWHDEPQRGLADPINRTVEVDANVKRECSSTAEIIVHDEIQTQLNAPENVQSIDGETDDGVPAIFVYRLLTINRKGEVMLSPEITFQSIREAVPESVYVTTTTGNSEHSCQFPVYVVDSIVQAD